MKNLKKILLSLMVLFLAFAFIGCPAEPEPELPVTPEPEPETPVTPVNNFKGNVFVGEYSEGPFSYCWGYIEFLDDTNGKMGMTNYDEERNPIIIEQPFTYSVTDDKATLKVTMEGEEFTVTTGELTNGSFTLSIEDEVTVCTKGDKSLFDVWTVVYEEEDLMKDFFCEFEYYVEVLVEEDDYELDTANKKIVLTTNGNKKCNGRWTIVYSEEEADDNESYIYNMLIFNMVGLEKPTDYTIDIEDIEELTITVTPSGMEKMQDATWTISYPAGGFEETSLEFMLFEFYEDYGLVDGDYTKNAETKTITLTVSGWEKVRWTVEYPEGTVVKAFASSSVACGFVSSIGLYEDTDYTVDYEARTITLTEEGWEKLKAGGGAGGDDSGEVTGETWTVLDSEGTVVKTFGSLEEAQAYAEENGLTPDDYTVDEGTYTITLK